jgi:hypothetical protein
MRVAWTNATLSGLSDRLLDLLLVATAVQSVSGNLDVTWKTNHHITTDQKRLWSSARYEDWKIENIQQYIQIPSFITFHQENEINFINNVDFAFDHYLGGIFAPSSFYDKYQKELFNKIGSNLTRKEYVNQFYRLAACIQPTDKLKTILAEVPTPDLSVHLRRTDKLSHNPDSGQLHHSMLRELDSQTEQCIHQILQETKKTLTIFFCSEDRGVVQSYKNKFSKINKLTIIDVPELLPEVVKTYLDLNMLACSRIIIMSQVHSNFSLLSSLLKKAPLIYFYDHSPLGEQIDYKHVFHRSRLRNEGFVSKLLSGRKGLRGSVDYLKKTMFKFLNINSPR